MAPRVHQRRVQRRPVLLPRQHFAEANEGHAPGTELCQSLLERRPDAGRPERALPPAPPCPALESVPTNEIRMARGDVAEPRHIDAVRAIADDAAVSPAVEAAARTTPLDVVHDVPADLPARVGETGVEQNPRALERRGAQKDDARGVHALRLGRRVDHAYARDTI